jgi:arylsulfatase B
MSRQSRFFYLPLLLMLAQQHAWSSARTSPPNIVVIVADDLGWNAVGYHNPEFRTPHIDQLAAEGIRLTHFYVAPMCSPTRAGLMTGRYPIRFGMARAVIPPQRDFGLPTAETTLPEMLAQLNYEQRGIFGKWHLGHRRAKWHPLNQGFTYFRGHYNGAIDYFRLTREEERDWHVNYATSDEQGYATDLIAAGVAQWIRVTARKDTPYFCYVPFNAPHGPFQAPERDVDQMRKWLGETKAAGNAAQRRRRRQGPDRAVYAAMIWKMDQGIGQILQAIDDSGESANTLVWFFSDNGGVSDIPANNAPLRGSKLTVYEGGIRVPACIRWPAGLPSGGHCDAQSGYIDVLPTVVAAAGGDPEKLGGQPLDGQNLLPVLREADGQSAGDVAREWYSYHGQSGEHAEHLAIHASGWKLKVNGPRLTDLAQLSNGENTVELFHIAEDPFEKHDLRTSHPQRVAKLGQLLIHHRALQPNSSVPRYSDGKAGFVPPKAWQLDPNSPDQLVGGYSRPVR